MDLGLNGKTVLVTGGSKGIGLNCALAFAAEGARVAICSRSRDNLDAALQRLSGAFGIEADCSDADAADAMVRRTEAEFGPLDILVNSAGAARRSPPDDLTPAAWRAAMEAKYFSAIYVIDPVIKRMAARGAASSSVSSARAARSLLRSTSPAAPPTRPSCWRLPVSAMPMRRAGSGWSASTRP